MNYFNNTVSQQHLLTSHFFNANKKHHTTQVVHIYWCLTSCGKGSFLLCVIESST